MAQQVFGPAAVVSVLNRAFTNTSPSNAVFNNQLAQAGTTEASQYAFAESFGATFAVGKTAAELSALVMANMGLDNQLLADALTDYITVHGTNKIGIIAYQLGTLLSPLENDATYGAAAKAWNAEVTASYEYSADPSNTVPSTSDVNGNEAGKNFVLTTNQDVRTGTSGADFFRGVAGNAFGNQDQTTLNSSDILDGAGGNDVLILNLTNLANYQGGARIKNIETLQLGTNGTAAFDYNINAGQNEITGVTTIVADQINATELLTLRNIVRDTATTDLPTISWVNDSTAINGMAGIVNVNYRAASVSGTADEQAVSLTNVRAGALNIAGGVETIKLTSAGTATNSVNAIDSITGATSTLEKVFITADAQLGGARKISTTAGTSGMEVDQAPANGNTEHVSNVAMGARVTLVDATGSTAGVNVAFTDGATAVNNTFIGGEGNDTAVFLGGNDKFEGGKGDDTVVFRQTNTSSNGIFFNNSDSIDGGEGKDTILIDYAKDSASTLAQVTIQTSEWLNSKGVDVLDIRSTNTRVQLDDSFVGRADVGSFEVVTNKIVQNDSTTSVADEANSRTQIDLTTVGANRAVKVTGGEGRETVIVSDALNGLQTISGGNGFDVLVVQNGATLTGQDLANVSGINTFNLVKTGAAPQTFNVDLTAAFLTAAIDSNAVAGTNKNVANAFRVVTDTRDASNTAINGIQVIGAGDVVNVTIDTTGLTTAGAVNLNDLIASGANLTVRNTSGTVLLAANNGAVTTAGTGVFAGATSANDLAYTTTQAAGVGTPLASGQASVGGGAGTGAAGNTFTLTGSPILTTALATNATLTSGTGPALSAGADTINTVNLLAAGSVIQDATAGDGDVLNYTSNGGAVVSPVIQGIETINFTGYGAGTGLNLVSSTGNTTLNVSGTNATIQGLANGRTVNLTSTFTGALVTGLVADTGTDSITIALNGQGTGSSVSVVDPTTGANTVETVTLNVAANSSLSGGLTLDGTTTLNIQGAGNLTLGAIAGFVAATNQTINASTMTGALTYTAVANDTVNAGFGNDVLSVAANVVSSLNGNNGDDSFTVTGGALTANNSIAGGAGTDTLNLVSLANAAHQFTNVSGIESIVVTQGAVGAGPTTLTLGNTTADSTLTINASALTTAGYTLSTGTGAYAANTNTTQTANVYKMNVTGGANADYLAGGQLADTLTGGAGADTIAGGRGADVIDVGASTTTNDRIWLNAGAGATGGDSGVFAAPATNTISTAAFDVITGMGVGDTIQLNSASYTGNAGGLAGLIANGVAVANTLVGLAVADNSIMQVRGTYDATTNTFVGSATGADTMMVLDTDATVGTTAYEGVVLVGYVAASVTSIGGNAGLITLA